MVAVSFDYIIQNARNIYIQRGNILRLELNIYLTGMLILTSATAQIDGNQYIDLVANPAHPYTSDVWGYIDSSGHEFAVFGVYDGVVILDISTDPANPVETAYIVGPNSSWRDLKTHGDHLYVTNESGGGLAIIDLSDPWQPELVRRDTTFFHTAHNLFIADGYAYIVGGDTPGIFILDLTDPVQPALAGSWSTTYVHDLYVKNDTLYASAIYEGDLHILDVKDKSDIQTLAFLDYGYYGAHSVWTTENSRFIITMDEMEGGHIKLWDAADYSNINLASEYEVGVMQSVHNAFVKGNLLFVSYYVFGTRIVDISDPYNPKEVAYYDFHPGSIGVYAGNWGVFPYTQSGLVFSTSMSGEGFFVLSPYPAYFEHEVPGETEDLANPVPIAVTVTEYADYPLDLSTMRMISGLEGVYTDTTLLSGTGTPSVFAGELPNPGQPGNLTYYFTLQNQTGRIIHSPVGALDTSHSFYIGPDITPPSVALSVHPNTIDNAGRYRLFATVEDNIDIDTATVHLQYHRNGVPGDSSLMTYNPGAGRFEGVIDFGEALASGDTVRYHLSVYDLSAGRNRANSPEEYFAIVSDLLIDDFENDLDQWTITNGWGRSVYAYSGDHSITQSPSGFYTPDTAYVLEYKTLFNLSARTDAWASFVHTYVLEPNAEALVEISQGSGEWSVVWRGSGSLGYQWDHEYVLIDQYAGMDSVRIRFRLLTYGAAPADGWYLDDIVFHVRPAPLTVSKTDGVLPTSFDLRQNYPNPFNPQTTIQFALPVSTELSIVVYDLLGREVVRLIDGYREPGYQQVDWNGRTATGKEVPSGIYIARLFISPQAGIAHAYTKSIKMLLLK